MTGASDGKIKTFSSTLLSKAAIAAMFSAAAAFAIFGKYGLSLFFAVVFLVSLSARIWGSVSLKRVSVSVETSGMRFFPEDELDIRFTVKNEKAAPLVWLTVRCRIEDGCCISPADERMIATYVMPGENPPPPERFLEHGLSFLMWFASASFDVRAKAVSRGLYDLDRVTLLSGDGFGLGVSEKEQPADEEKRIIVYPKLCPVDVSMFIRNAWEYLPGTSGFTEDMTLLKTVRDYTPEDSFKKINFRLAARGLPLQTNIYETVTARQVFFVIDTASFKKGSRQEFEDAASILASIISELCEAGVLCGVKLPWNRHFGGDIAVTAADGDKSAVLDRLSAMSLDDGELTFGYEMQIMESASRVYYVSYDKDAAYKKMHGCAVFVGEGILRPLLYKASENGEDASLIRLKKGANK